MTQPPSEPPRLPAPERIGRYTIEHELGRGGMGVVYRARDTLLDRPVALKMILDEAACEEGNLKRFHREARAAAKLAHPSIVAVHEIGDYMGRPFIAMEFIAGDSLDVLLAGRELPLEHALAVVRDVGLALENAHQHGIVHRDVKPENVIVTTSYEHGADAPVLRAHLTDFGLARRTSGDDRVTAKGDVVGTLAYMAPEQIDDIGEPGPACDVHALGAVLYQALAGHRPFEADNSLRLMRKIVKDDPEPFPRANAVPAELERLTRRCLEKAPEKRPSAGEVARELDRFLAGSTAPPRGARPLPRALAVAVVVLPVLAALSFLLDVKKGEPGEPNPPPAPVASGAHAPSPAEAAKVAINAARAREKAGDVDRAIVEYERALALDPKSVVALLALGSARLKKGDLAAALEDDARALALEPRCAEALCHRAGIFADRGDAARAIEEATRSLAIDDRRALAWRHRAAARRLQRDAAGAIDDATRALALEPRLASAFVVRGLAHVDLREPEAARADFSRAIEIDPGDAATWTDRGFVRAELGDFDGAIDDDTRAIDLAPAMAQPWLNRAAARRRKRDLDGAIADATRGLELEPSNTPALQTRALAFLEKGDVDAAIADNTCVIEIDPSSWEAFLNRGVAFKAAGQADRARADFGQAIALRPDDPQAYFSRGKLLFELHDKVATADLERFLELASPDDGRVALVRRFLDELRSR